MLEIHGKRKCPFAWRVGLAAREKGAPFEWVPYDVTSPVRPTKMRRWQELAPATRP